MTKYRINFSGMASASVVVETDKTDPEEILDELYVEGLPGLCAQCSGWGRSYSLELPEEWDADEDEDGPIVLLENGERYVVADE